MNGTGSEPSGSPLLIVEEEVWISRPRPPDLCRTEAACDQAEISRDEINTEGVKFFVHFFG